MRWADLWTAANDLQTQKKRREREYRICIGGDNALTGRAKTNLPGKKWPRRSAAADGGESG